MPPDCPHSSCAFSLCPGLGSSNSRAQCSAGVALQAVRVRHISSLMLGLMGCVVTLGGNSLKSSLCVYAKALFSAGSSFPGPLCCCSLALAHCSVVLCCLVLSPEMSPCPSRSLRSAKSSLDACTVCFSWHPHLDELYSHWGFFFG